jgi:tRNA A-37 threonylcarbamoyl transferase component Bud32
MSFFSEFSSHENFVRDNMNRLQNVICFRPVIESVGEEYVFISERFVLKQSSIGIYTLNRHMPIYRGSDSFVFHSQSQDEKYVVKILTKNMYNVKEKELEIELCQTASDLKIGPHIQTTGSCQMIDLKQDRIIIVTYIVMEDMGDTLLDYIFNHPKKVNALRNSIDFPAHILDVQRQLHNSKGFVQGDIHAQNIIVRDPSASNGRKFVMIDYGRACHSVQFLDLNLITRQCHLVVDKARRTVPSFFTLNGHLGCFHSEQKIVWFNNMETILPDNFRVIILEAENASISRIAVQVMVMIYGIHMTFNSLIAEFMIPRYTSFISGKLSGRLPGTTQQKFLSGYHYIPLPPEVDRFINNAIEQFNSSVIRSPEK